MTFRGGVYPVHLFLSLSLETVFHRKPLPITISAVADMNADMVSGKTQFLNSNTGGELKLKSSLIRSMQWPSSLIPGESKPRNSVYPDDDNDEWREIRPQQNECFCHGHQSKQPKNDIFPNFPQIKAFLQTKYIVLSLH